MVQIDDIKNQKDIINYETRQWNKSYKLIWNIKVWLKIYQINLKIKHKIKSDWLNFRKLAKR